VLRWLALLTLVLLVPIVPFLFFHSAVERWIGELIEAPPRPPTIILLVIGLLSIDVLLPVPSSLVSTLAGGQLSLGTATLTSWVGLNLGATLGFGLSRTYGRAIAERMAAPADLDRMQRVSDRYATGALVLTRGLPILAEAMVLLMGIQRLPWRRFWPPVLLSNLGLAMGYSILGHYAGRHHWLPVALSVSVALPLLATWWYRRRWTSDPRPN
jgi:uncharacterized membrane protein YdjX (TVP38/TMEM64 family)